MVFGGLRAFNLSYREKSLQVDVRKEIRFKNIFGNQSNMAIFLNSASEGARAFPIDDAQGSRLPLVKRPELEKLGETHVLAGKKV